MLPPLDGRSSPLATPPPAPPQYVAKSGDTVQTVASQYRVAPEALASSNGMATDTVLAPGQVLTLPADAVTSVQDFKADSPPPQTPAEKTDAAYQALKDAKARLESDKKSPAGRADIRDDETAVANASQQFQDAVKAEIDAKVAQVSDGVPPQYRTPESKLIEQYGNQILQRHAGDPTAQAQIKAAIADDTATHQAGALIPDYYGDWSAADKLKGINLDGQPQAVIDKVLADPRVQGWIKQAAADVGKPYEGMSDQDITYAYDQSTDASFKLLSATDGMPPELARALVQASMPTIQKIARLEIGYQGSVIPFDNMQDLIAHLGTGPEADALVKQIASAYVDGGAGPALAHSSFVTNPALGVEMARQLSLQGDKGSLYAADGIIRSLEYAAQNQKRILDDDLKHYGEATSELNWYIQSLGPSMTPAQRQQAIDDYIAGKGEEWQKEVEADKDRIVADARKLNDLLTALHDLPPEIAASTAGPARSVAQQLGEDESTQQAIEFSASQDPTLFEGEAGESAAKFWVEVGHKSKDFTASIAKAYVAGHVLPELKTLNPNDPASVAKVRHVLEDLRGNAAMLGVSQAELDAGVNKLEKLLDSLKTESLQDAIHGKGINALGEVKTELGELGTLNSGPAGLIFRTLAFGITGAALVNSAGSFVSDPSFQKLIDTVGLTVGFSQDTAALAAKIGLVDKGGALGSWGLGTSAAGEATEKFIGVLATAYYVVGGINALSEHDYPAVAFNSAAAAGIGIATFGEAAWTGPVGWGVALAAVIGLGWYEHVKEANKYEPGNDSNTVPFLMHAGFSEAAANELANQTGDGVSPVTLLVEYAKDKGYDMSDPTQRQAVVDWINAMPTDKLAHVRDWMNNSLDELGGDAGKLGTDTTPVWGTTYINGGGGFPVEVHTTPKSVGELDGMMQEYGVTPLAPR